MKFFALCASVLMTVLFITPSAYAWKKCEHPEAEAQFPIYGFRQSKRLGDFQRTNYGPVEKRYYRDNKCYDYPNLMFSINALRVASGDIDEFYFYVYGNMCSSKVQGALYNRNASPTGQFYKAFFLDKNEIVQGAYEAIKESLTLQCGRPPQSVSIIVGKEPRYDGKSSAKELVAKRYTFEPVYKGTLLIASSGEISVVDNDPSLRYQYDPSSKPLPPQTQVANAHNGPAPTLNPSDTTAQTAYIGMSYSEYAPTTNFKRTNPGLGTIREPFTPLIKVETLDPNGPACQVGLKAGDLIRAIRVYQPTSQTLKLSGYWESYSLDQGSFAKILSELKPDQSITVIWSGSDLNRYQFSTLTPVNRPDATSPRTVTNCRADAEKMYQRHLSAQDYHRRKSGGTVYSIVRDLPSAEELGHQFVDLLDQQKGASANWRQKLSSFDLDSIPPQWDSLKVDDMVLNYDAYDKLLWPFVPGTIIDGNRLHPIIPQEMKFTPQSAAELVNEVISYSFTKWHFASENQLTSALRQGAFIPYKKDIELTYKGFGRASISDPIFQRIITIDREGDEIPSVDTFQHRMDRTAIAQITNRSNYASLSSFDQKRLTQEYLIKNPSPEAVANDQYQQIITDFQDYVRTGDFSLWRSGNIRDYGRQSWNGRFGHLTQTELLQMYMNFECDSLERDYGSSASIFFRDGDLSCSNLNFNLTYEEVSRRLPSATRETFKDKFRLFDSLSSFRYFVKFRSDEYDQKRRDYWETLKVIEYLRYVQPGPVVRS